jgi:hypothetical protein
MKKKLLISSKIDEKKQEKKEEINFLVKIIRNPKLNSLMREDKMKNKFH